MINTLIKKSNKPKVDLDSLLNNMYLLPQWEKIESFSLQQKSFFVRKFVNVDLFRKFSSKNMLEKYSLRLEDDVVVGTMDLKVYKDSVYIINVDSSCSSSFEQIFTKLIQVAVEKALYNTTEKEVKINLSYSLIKQNKMKRLLSTFDFVSEKEQSSYEKELFGETYILKAEESIFWQKQIKLHPILINE
ncbi:MAG: hypothetical protein E7Z90_04380 [Cyanobacteria bacterium SIG29]|nr:hypothetical protein [Cyanobacteria bacterium SIG29]